MLNEPLEAKDKAIEVFVDEILQLFSNIKNKEFDSYLTERVYDVVEELELS